MKFTRSVLGASALGAGFGAATSLSNRLASPFEPDSFARVASLVLDAGWAWAGLAVVAGWLAGAPARGAVAGALALIAATSAYFGMDSIIRGNRSRGIGPSCSAGGSPVWCSEWGSAPSARI